MEIAELYGRRVLFPQVDDFPIEEEAVQKLPTIEIRTNNIRCLRCGTITEKTLACLPKGQFYCPRCTTLGRVSTLDKFYHVQEPNQFTVPDKILTWNGELSSLQAKASQTVSQRMEQHQHQLLWAVTGAGKTMFWHKRNVHRHLGWI